MRNFVLLGGIIITLLVAVHGFDLHLEANAQLSSDTFPLNENNTRPHGITFHDDKFWVTDSVAMQVFAYNSDGTFDDSSGFSLHDENTTPRGIVYNDNKFWVVDDVLYKIFAYNSDGSPDENFDIVIPAIDKFVGIDFHNSKFWLTGLRADKIYACNIDDTRTCVFDTDSEIILANENRAPMGVGFYTNLFWVIDGPANQFFAYESDGTLVNELKLLEPASRAFGVTFHDNKLWTVSDKFDTLNSFVPFAEPDLTTPFQLNPGNIRTAGITFYDDKFWITDLTEDRVYVYEFVKNDDGSNSTKVVHTVEDEFTLDKLHASPHGIDFANDRFWIVENGDRKINAYGVDGTYYPDSAISLAPENSQALSLVFYNEKFWLTDRHQNKIFAYDADGTYDESSGFELYVENTSTFGLTTYDDKFYVLDRNLNRVFAYDASGTYNESSGFELHPANQNAFGIVYYDDKFWIADTAKNEVFAYDTNGQRILGYGFLLDNGNTNPTGIIFVDDRFWVVEHDDRRIYDYTYDPPEPIEHDPFSEFTLHEMNQFPTGITFDGTNLWVVDSDKGLLFSYTLDGEFVDGPFSLYEENKRPTGITFDGTKLWISDEHIDKLFSYNLNGVYDGSIEILVGTDEPSGVIFVDDKFWVIDEGNDNVIAYNTKGIQVASSGFMLYDENNSPKGITFVDNTFWVADKNGKVYPYPMVLNFGLLLSVDDPDFGGAGEEMKLASNLAIADFNAYLKGMGSIWKIAEQFRDTDLDPEKALEEVIELKANDIDVIVGVPTSASVNGISNYVNNNDMVVISCCSSASQLEISDNIFRMVPPDSGQAPLLANHILGLEKTDIIIIHRDDIWGVGLKDAIVTSFEEQNGTVLSTISYDSSDTFHSDFVGIAKSTSDIISAHDDSSSVGVVFLGLAETIAMMGVAGDYSALSSVTWFGAGAVADAPGILEEGVVSFAMETSFSVVQFTPKENDVTDRVKEHIMAELGREPIVYAYSAYDAVWLAGDAMLRTGSDVGRDVLENVEDVAANRTGAIGPNKLTSFGDLELSNYTIRAVRDGMWKDLGPVNASSIMGTIFSDVNKNGIRDTNEPGISNYTMTAINLADPSQIFQTNTDENGMYEFEVEPSSLMLVQAGLFPPNHTVSNVSTSWYTYITIPANGTVTFDLGFIPVTPEEEVTLHIIMYDDSNLDGIKDADERVIGNLDGFYVYTYTAGPVAYPVPDDMGNATITGLIPADFAVLVNVDVLADAGYAWVTTSYELHGDSGVEYIKTVPIVANPAPGSVYTMLVGLNSSILE